MESSFLKDTEEGALAKEAERLKLHKNTMQGKWVRRRYKLPQLLGVERSTSHLKCIDLHVMFPLFHENRKYFP